ncbi:MAG: sugar ABC transporter permease [Anaerolineales bacterium]|nr:sugar ABC transporter permease [Anaerolineales bacterium]
MQNASELRKKCPLIPSHVVVFLAPATIIYTLFMIYPLVDSLRLSFFTTTEQGTEMFAGFQNFITLLSDELWAPRFWGAFKNNFLFFAVHMLVQNPIGLLLAAILSNHRLSGKAFYRTIIFLPTILSFVIVGFIWQLMLSPLWGIARDILEFVRLGDLFQPWLGLESSALITLSFISVWQFVGIPMMLLYAALIAIPDELIEAAFVDGATAWNVFWRIKFPLILPTLGIATILTFVGNFNAFDLVYTTQGVLAGPNFSTDLLGTLFYRTFFGQQLQLGNPTMGATVATMMFLIILSGVLLYMFVWQRRVQTYEL